MALGLFYAPQFPLAGQQLTLGATGSVGNLLEFFVQGTPAGSNVTKGRIANYGQTFVPDVPGVYSIQVNDWTKNYASPRWNGDNANTGALSPNPPTVTANVLVAQVITRRLGIEPDTADLILVVQDTNIRAAVLTNARSKAAEIASQDTGVLLALNGCTGTTVSALDVALATKANDLRTKYEAHRVNITGLIHSSADTVNVVKHNNAATTDDGAITLLNDIRFAFSQHELLIVLSAVAVHNNPDTTDTVRAPAASDKRSGHVLADNLWSMYEAHRVNTTISPALIVHGNVDGTNTLVAQLPLAVLQSTFMTAAYKAALAVPDGQHSATVALVTALGFTT